MMKQRAKMDSGNKNEKMLILRRSIEELQAKVNEYLDIMQQDINHHNNISPKDINCNTSNIIPDSINNDGYNVHTPKNSDNTSTWFVTPSTSFNEKENKKKKFFPILTNFSEVEKACQMDENNQSSFNQTFSNHSSTNQSFFPLNSTARQGRNIRMKLDFSSILEETSNHKINLQPSKPYSSLQPSTPKQHVITDNFQPTDTRTNYSSKRNSKRGVLPGQLLSPINETLQVKPACCIGSVFKLMTDSIKKRKRNNEEDKENREEQQEQQKLRRFAATTDLKMSKTSTNSANILKSTGATRSRVNIMRSSSTISSRPSLSSNSSASSISDYNSIRKKLKSFRECMDEKSELYYVELGEL